MRLFLKHNAIYLLLYIGILCFIAQFLLSYDKVTIHKSINVIVGNPYIDTFFKYITHFGDGLFAFLIAAIFLFKNTRISIYIIITYLGAGLVSSILKHNFFREIYRPHFVFHHFTDYNLIQVEGVDLFARNSFPSGHALSAFALFFCLLFATKNHGLKSLYFLLALLSAFSRVYLSQHWLIDIYVGSIIGVLFSMLFYFAFYQSAKWPNLNQPISQLFSKNKKERV